MRPAYRSYRLMRWIVMASVLLLFHFSFKWKLDLLTGTLNGSRFSGFHLEDIFTTLQLLFSFGRLETNVLIGFITIVVVYFLVGGRTFCAWICPFNLLAEWSEILHLWLVRKGLVKERHFRHTIRYAFFILFLILAYLTGYLYFETFNPIGMIVRSATYGMEIALVFVGLILLVEVLFIRRAWCRYVCPVGTAYGLLGKIAMLRVKFIPVDCPHCNVCYDVCIAPEALKKVHEKAENSGKAEFVTHMECTNCGRCIDVCRKGLLKYGVRYIDRIT